MSLFDGSSEDSNVYFTVDTFNDNCSSADDFVIFHQNLRSFDQNYDDFSGFVNNINSDIDVLIFTETWFSNISVGEIEGFRGIHTYRSVNRGGGVSIYVRDTLNSYIIPEYCFINDFMECCAVKVCNLEVRNTPSLTILGIYRPPVAPINLFMEFLTDSLLVSFKKNSVLIGGDLNIDIAAPVNPGVDLIATFNSFNYYPLITVPTRVSNNSSTCIDHFWYNNFNVVNSGCFETSISDHFTIFTVLKFSCSKKLLKVAFRDHNDENLLKLKLRVHKLCTDFNPDFCDGDVNSITTLFINSLWESYNESCPIKYKTLSQSRLSKPWIAGDILDSINNKHRLFKLYKAGQVDFDVYNNFKNSLAKKINRAKLDFYRNKFNNCKNNLKKTWKSLNSLMRGRDKKESVVLSDTDGSDITDKKHVADMFCDFFSTIANDIDRDIPPPVSNPLDYLTYFNPCSFYVYPASPSEVENVVMGFDNKSCNVDNIPIFIFKFLSKELSLILCKLFNLSISSGTFPSC